MKIQLENVLATFDQIAKTPRPSGAEKRIRNFLIEWADALGYTHVVDSAGNLVIWTKNEKPTLSLQCHIDMVYAVSEGITFDPNNDSIDWFVDDGVLRAKNTSLGSDNGIGMALMMEAAKLYTPLCLELIFTVDEERGLIGASMIDPSNIKGERLLNLDNEMNHEICTGTAGLSHSKLVHIGQQSSGDNPDTKLLEIAVDGFQGGHSGAEIHQSIGNAIYELARFVDSCPEIREIYSFKGGTADNAIPTSAKAIVSVESMEKVRAQAVRIREEWKSKYPSGAIQIHPFQEKIHPKYDFRSAISELVSVDIGVIEWENKEAQFPLLSCNLAEIETCHDSIEILYSLRSSITEKMEEYHEVISSKYSCDVEYKLYGHGWKAPDDCEFIAEIEASMRKIDPKAHRSPIHAGLEIGKIQDKIPSLKVVSIGPTILYPHSTNEHIYIKDIQLYCDYLSQILNDLCVN